MVTLGQWWVISVVKDRLLISIIWSTRCWGMLLVMLCKTARLPPQLHSVVTSLASPILQTSPDHDTLGCCILAAWLFVWAQSFVNVAKRFFYIITVIYIITHLLGGWYCDVAKNCDQVVFWGGIGDLSLSHSRRGSDRCISTSGNSLFRSYLFVTKLNIYKNKNVLLTSRAWINSI